MKMFNNYIICLLQLYIFTLIILYLNYHLFKNFLKINTTKYMNIISCTNINMCKVYKCIHKYLYRCFCLYSIAIYLRIYLTEI